MEDNERMTLATELLHEIKASAKRWFIIAIIELFMLLGVSAGFIWYVSLPIDEYTVEQDTGIGNNYNVGGDYTNGNGENKLQEESR